MSALTWTTLQTELLVALAQAPPPYNVIPPDFASLFPRATSYAEGRINSEIPLLANRVENRTLTTTANSRQLSLASIQPPVLVLESFSLSTSTGIWPFDRTTLDYINAFWPAPAGSMDPGLADNIGRWWAPLDASLIVMAPTPNAAYQALCNAYVQPTPISAANPSTYLSTTYPDLLVAACMVHLEGELRRNFGAQADDPKQALSWEGTYQSLKDACAFEEARRRGLAPNFPRPPQKAA